MSEVKIKSILEDFNTRLWRYHIKIPLNVASQFINGMDKRVLCILNGGENFHAGLMPTGDNSYFININKEIRIKNKLELGEEIIVTLKKDTSKYGMEICQEFEELLNQDVIFEGLFHALPPGKQRNLIYIATKPKSLGIRLEKSLVIAEYLKANEGNLDFKMLNLALKSRI